MIMLQQLWFILQNSYAQHKLFLSANFLRKDFNKLHKPPVSLDY